MSDPNPTPAPHGFDYAALNPGIRDTVRWLRGHGFTTVSSGDGVTHECPACDPDFPFVQITCTPKKLVKHTRRLAALLNAIGITLGQWTEDGAPAGVVLDANYFVQDDFAGIMLIGLDDAGLRRCLDRVEEAPADDAHDVARDLAR